MVEVTQKTSWMAVKDKIITYKMYFVIFVAFP